MIVRDTCTCIKLIFYHFVACAAGLYRSKNDRHDGDCLACPENTARDAVGATICGCAENYFRYDGEGPEIGCTCESHSLVTINVYNDTHCTS